MLQFRAPEDLNALPDSHPAYPLIQNRMDLPSASIPLHTATASLTTGLKYANPSRITTRSTTASGVAAKANRRPLGVAATPPDSPPVPPPAPGSAPWRVGHIRPSGRVPVWGMSSGFGGR